MGYQMVVPIYQAGIDLRTSEERRQHSIGFLIAAECVSDLFSGVKQEFPVDHHMIEVYGSTSTGTRLLYASAEERDAGELNLQRDATTEDGELRSTLETNIMLGEPGKTVAQ